MNTQMEINGNKLEIKREVINVTPMQEPDLNWVQNCKECDIPHRFYEDELPTLKYVIDVEGWDEYPAEGHWECKGCGEHITPKYRTPEYESHVLGSTSYTINGKEVDEKEFKKFINANIES